MEISIRWQLNMSNRLTKIYTRTGDKGDTGLTGGSRISKDHVLVQAMGDVDELNSLLGLLRSKDTQENNVSLLNSIQNKLFDLGAELSMPECTAVTLEDVDWLEQQLDAMNHDLPPLKEFILPGGDEVVSVCHVCRSVCRRAERSLVSLNRESEIRQELLAYINRLSDLLFVLARTIAKQRGVAEIYWQSSRISGGEVE